MTRLIDQLAEQHIRKAFEQGDFDNLPGHGKPLELDDDSQVPESLRAGYRILKNSGFLPPEMQQRKEAIKLCDMVNSLQEKGDHFRARESQKKLEDLELMLKVKGVDTTFLQAYLKQKNT